MYVALFCSSHHQAAGTGREVHRVEKVWEARTVLEQEEKEKRSEGQKKTTIQTLTISFQFKFNQRIHTNL